MPTVPNSKLRGLILRPEHAQKIFQPDSQGRTKTLELRSHACRCVSPGEQFFIVACGQGKNASGVSVVQILGTVIFRGNETIKHDKVVEKFDQHLCPPSSYADLRQRWAQAKDHCVGWKLSDAKLLTPAPKWYKHSHQDCFGASVCR